MMKATRRASCEYLHRRRQKVGGRRRGIRPAAIGGLIRSRRRLFAAGQPVFLNQRGIYIDNLDLDQVNEKRLSNQLHAKR